jgi:Protein of unknown function (DUF3043)
MSTDGTQSNSESTSGKGRPTPSRKDAQKARQEALKGDLKSREGRKAASKRDREKRAEARTQMLSGNPKYLLARDAGPAREFARNFVDSRLSAGEYFVPAAFVVLILGLIKVPTVQTAVFFGWMGMLVFVVADTIFLTFKLRTALKVELPSGTNLRGCVTYGVMRALQLRRFRMPKPQVSRTKRK